MEHTKVAMTVEVISAIASEDLTGSDKVRLKEDTRNFLLSTMNIDLDDTLDFTIVDNTADEMNLVLPYYSMIPHCIERLEDDELCEISGGELVLFPYLIVSLIVGGAFAGSMSIGLSVGLTSKRLMGEHGTWPK